jgi:fido (protein-threonine AMPylation protein)
MSGSVPRDGKDYRHRPRTNCGASAGPLSGRGRAQIEYQAWPVDEIGARFHHRLVAIHLFPDGNGRHSRLMTDLLLTRLGQERFAWGAGNLVAEGTVRKNYIEALQMADGKDSSALFRFVRSGTVPVRTEA